MEFEYRDIVDAVADGIRAAKDPEERPGAICPITPFSGLDDRDRQVRAVGVCWYEGMMQFVGVVTDKDGSIYPITLDTMYPAEVATPLTDGFPMAPR